MLRRGLPILGALVGIVGLAINFSIIVGSLGTASATNPHPRSLVDSLIYFWSFYTHLNNLWLVLIYVGLITGWRPLQWLLRPVPLAAAASNITLVMLFFHFMLAPNYTFTGGLLIANNLMHYVAPLLYLIWWLRFAPHGTLRLLDVPLMLVPGLAYVAYTLGRGVFIHEYPYAILDVNVGGYGRVAIGVLVLVGLVAVFSAILVGVDRLLARPRRPVVSVE